MGVIAALCVRCVAVLTVVNTVLFVVAVVVSTTLDPQAGVSPTAVYILVVGLLVACVPILLVGFPAGVLTAHLLRGSSRERVHVLVFALVGAVLSVTIFATLDYLSVVPWFTLVAAAEGAVGAGGARWWTGRMHARRAPIDDAQGAALPWGRIGP
ncbi:hypothetical protein CXY01_30820 [Cellulomonas xylanilytica]|uniref:Uncharacterized protein n=1 Tax=Cellulomonas xylanilytica TaxID=233583 RepID=A0A510V6S2_9CELL|nr:hypothetical protein CXY01_30820 [Cellulomonas xylanilytica]